MANHKKKALISTYGYKNILKTKKCNLVDKNSLKKGNISEFKSILNGKI